MAVHVANFKEALANKIIPATLSGDNGWYIFTDLIYKDAAAGNTRHWQIKVALGRTNEEGKVISLVKIKPEFLEPKAEVPSGTIGIIRTVTGIEGSKNIDIPPTIIKTGKNIGRATQTNVLTQALRDAFGEYSKKLKQISVASVGRPIPMLAETINREASAQEKSVKGAITKHDFTTGITVQRKYNGTRGCIYLSPDGNVVGYSRKGEEWQGTQHNTIKKIAGMMFSAAPKLEDVVEGIVAADLATYYKTNKEGQPQLNLYLDGESYKHGVALQDISGSMRTKLTTETTLELDFIIYDCFFPGAANGGLKYSDRMKYLNALFASTAAKFPGCGDNNKLFTEDAAVTPEVAHVERASSFKVSNFTEVDTLFADFLKDGYEGAILRRDSGLYKNNYRSDAILKYKPVDDDEFECIDFTAGTAGVDKDAVIWTCKTKDGKTFDVTPSWTKEKRKQIYHCLSKRDGDQTLFEKYIKGLMLNIEYRGVTKDGKPSHAVATHFRVEDDPEAKNPIDELLVDPHCKSA